VIKNSPADFADKNFIAIMNTLENLIRIEQTSVQNVQPDRD